MVSTLKHKWENTAGIFFPASEQISDTITCATALSAVYVFCCFPAAASHNTASLLFTHQGSVVLSVPVLGIVFVHGVMMHRVPINHNLLHPHRFVVSSAFCRFVNNFVPIHEEIRRNDVEQLQIFVDNANNLTVLTGAGISTESGIPDYRSAHVGLYARNGYRPMTYSEFLKSPSARQRYWARSFLSWRHFYDVLPNSGHLSLSQWQRGGKLRSCITQNVDRLHHKAGTEDVVELHGNLYTVKCLKCNYRIPRILFQQMLSKLNSELLLDPSVASLLSESSYNRLVRPDGDIDVSAQFIEQFQFPNCDMCQGTLKPDIIFFGDNVNSKLVSHIYQLIEESDSLLVVGSSLQVFSSYRFALHAHTLKKNILIVNIGPTRADDLPNISKLNVKIGDILPQVKI